MHIFVNIVLSAAGGSLIASGFVVPGILLMMAGFGLGVALAEKEEK